MTPAHIALPGMSVRQRAALGRLLDCDALRWDVKVTENYWEWHAVKPSPAQQAMWNTARVIAGASVSVDLAAILSADELTVAAFVGAMAVVARVEVGL